MLTTLRQNKEKLRSAVESAVLNQCNKILGDIVKFQIEGLIGITEVDAEDVVLVKIIHNFSGISEHSRDKLVKDLAVSVEVKQEISDTDNMGNIEGHVSDLINPGEHDSPHKITDTLFGEGAYEFNMRQDIGGENLSLSVESFQDSFTDINMSTSESNGSLSDNRQTEDSEKFCDNEGYLNNGHERSLQTPEPQDHIDLDSIKYEKPVEINLDQPAIEVENTCKVQIKGKSRLKNLPGKHQDMRHQGKHHDQRQRDAERMRMRRRLRQSQMTEEERQRQRERWRDKKRKQRLKRKLSRNTKSDSDKIKDCAKLGGNQTDSPSSQALNRSIDSPDLTQKASKNTANEQSPKATNQTLAIFSQKEHGLPCPPFNWSSNSPNNMLNDRKITSQRAGVYPYRRYAIANCLTVSPIPNRGMNGNMKGLTNSQVSPQVLDLTRDDCHLRPDFNLQSPVEAGLRPISHGPPISYSSANSPPFSNFSFPYMNTQSTFTTSSFKPPYIKAEPGLGNQPCCNLSGANPAMNSYYKHLNSNPGFHAWNQGTSMPNFEMPVIKQEPMTAYNNWL